MDMYDGMDDENEDLLKKNSSLMMKPPGVEQELAGIPKAPEAAAPLTPPSAIATAPNEEASNDDEQEASRAPAGAAPSLKVFAEKLKNGTPSEKKDALSLASGVDKKDITDDTLSQVASKLRGASVASSQGIDPTTVPQAQLAKLDPAQELKKNQAEEEENLAPGELSNHKKLMMALTAAIPTVLGYALGGYAGGAVGAQAGQQGVDMENKEALRQEEIKRTQPKLDAEMRAKVAETNYKIAENARLERQASLEAEARDPNSVVSKKMRESTRNILKASAPKLAGSIDDSMSAADIQAMAKEGVLGKAVSGELANAGRLIVAERVGDRNDVLRQGMELRKDAQTQHIADRFDNDKIIQTSQTQKNKIDQALHTLQNSDKITPQMLSEIQTDYATAMAQGGSHAISSENKKEFTSYAIELANLKQRLLNRPEDAASPEVKQYLVDLGHRLNESYDRNMAARAQQLGANRKFSHNAEAQAALEAKMNQYSQPAPAPKKDIPEGNGVVKMPDGSIRSIDSIIAEKKRRLEEQKKGT